MREVEDPPGIDRTLQATDVVSSETVRGSRRLLASDGTIGAVG
jgi:hypothetical protein